MKTLKYATIVTCSLLFISLKIEDDKSVYNVPLLAHSVCSVDLENDGDIDIVIGNSYSTINDWGGISILENIGNGYFNFNDSMYFEHGFPEVRGDFLDDNGYIDLFSVDGITSPYTVFITIIYNYGVTQFDSIKSFEIYSEPPNPFITSGDVNGDGHPDLLFAHNNDFLWGIIYNDGAGDFSAPEYFDLDFPPLDIACADLNDDGRDDVIIAGGTIEVYFSSLTGFQKQILGNTLPWSSCYSLLTADFDNDSDEDVILTATSYNNHSNVYMFENLGSNQFYEHPNFEFTPFCSFSQIADFENDSLPDMIFIDWDNTGLIIYNNKGNFQLEFDQYIDIDNLGYQLSRVNCNDFDGNGHNDIVAIISTQMTLPYNVVILFNDGSGNFVPDPITYIPENLNSDPEIVAWPNPFSNRINFDFSNIQFNELILSIYNMQGRMVFSSTLKNQKGGKNMIRWNACDLNNNAVKPGAYYAIVELDGSFYKSVKLIKH